MKRRISESALILPFIKRCLIEDRSLLLPSSVAADRKLTQ